MAHQKIHIFLALRIHVQGGAPPSYKLIYKAHEYYT